MLERLQPPGTMDNRPWLQHYDPGVPQVAKFEDVPVPQFLERTAGTHPDVTALVFLNGRLSYGQLKDQVDRLATALAALGVGKDSRVAIQLPNLPQTVIAYYATLRLGAQAVLTNPLYTTREMEHQWKDAGCRVAIVTDMAIPSDKIDEAKVEEARQRAAARLQDKLSDEEVATINASLARSLAQLHVKRRRHV